MKRSSTTGMPGLRLVWTGAAFAAGVVCGGWWLRSPVAAPVSARVEAAPLEKRREASFKNLRAGGEGQDLDHVLAMRDSERRSAGLREAGRALAMENGPAAWARGLSLSGLADREEFCLAVMEAWAETDAASAWEAALRLPAGSLRTECLTAALGGWARVAPQEALAVAQRSLTGAAREEAVAAVVAVWSGSAAAEASTWAAENLSVPGASGALRAAVHAWADQSPAAAGQWVAGLPPGQTLDTAAGALIAGWSRQSPDEAAAWLGELGISPGLEAAAADLAGRWASHDPAAATAWAAALEKTLMARDAATRALGEWAVVAPQDAAAWLAAKAPAFPSLAPALHDALGASWAGQDAAGAAAWLGSLSDPYARADAAVPVFNTWAAMDAPGLSDWIARNSQSPVIDEARAQLALTRSEAAPAEAIGLALSLTSPQDAADLGRQILDDWRVRDLVAADYWMVANPKAADFIEPLE